MHNLTNLITKSQMYHKITNMYIYLHFHKKNYEYVQMFTFSQKNYNQG